MDPRANLQLEKYLCYKLYSCLKSVNLTSYCNLMKPEDLKPPFPRGAMRTAIHDRVWYAPARPHENDNFVFPGWNHADLFGNTNPVHIEYCSGNGAWIADKALQNPGINWVAVEKKFERVRKVWSKIKNHNLPNLIVVAGEAFHATQAYFPTDTVSAIYINFPDPWPKKRHAKHRLIQDAFADEMARILSSGQPLMFVTDDVPYSEWFTEVMNRNVNFNSAFPSPFYMTDESGYGTSYFEQLWRSKGRLIRYHRYHKLERKG